MITHSGRRMARRFSPRGLIPQLLPELRHGVRPRNETYLVDRAYANRSTRDSTGNGLVSSTPLENEGLDSRFWFRREKWLESPQYVSVELPALDGFTG
jgi:hypothetical protein